MADLSWFWADIGSSLGLVDIEVTMRKPWLRAGDSLTTHLSGYSEGLLVEAGVHYAAESHDASFTFAAVQVLGLPSGMVVGELRDRKPSIMLGDRGVWLECVGGVRRVAIGQPAGTRIEMDGLVLEQVAPTVNLDSYLTARRARALCSIEGRLDWHEQQHRVVNFLDSLDNDPFPSQRDIKQTRKDQPETMNQIWAKEMAVIDLAQQCLDDSHRLSAEAAHQRPTPPV